MYYLVNVNTTHNSTERVVFYSPFVAMDYAKRYLNCTDVESVNVENHATHEIIFYGEN